MNPTDQVTAQLTLTSAPAADIHQSLGLFSASNLDFTALIAKAKLYALQGVAYARLQAIEIANRNLGTLAGADQQKIAVDKAMELYQVFELAVPILAATTLDDMLVRQVLTTAVKEAYSLVSSTLDGWTKQATTPPAATPAPDPLPSGPVVPSVPDTTFAPPVTNDSTLPQGGLS
ncbi:hypothetical protein GCM10022631_08680 [Deinococcus rubellus]|uniref:Phasin family protein n=1 Tax=Deinococcus rubellus TaxID=1889240 RepID=A0ABY5YHC1_9DEIO|nr:hypothetical protein [Deinococcus rubellus]UWX64210.1 hypothetical protein N0D28_00590 [Deinococcus rubellus]